MAEKSGTGLEGKIYEALADVIDPDLGRNIVELGFVKDLILKKTLLGRWDISLTIELTTPACPVKDQFRTQAFERLKALPDVGRVDIKMSARVSEGKHGSEGPGLRGVKNIIAVGAGKGGVGKSTVAVNLALSLRQAGARVGILDADIYGPSLGLMLGLRGMPEVKDSRIHPQSAFGLAALSFSSFAPVGEAVIWRGAMVAKAVEQMLKEVDWDAAANNPEKEALDYLIVDLPPGTGDVPLTLAHTVRLAGAVVVSTPQDVSLLDATKAVAFFEKLQVPVLGLVENMSGFECPHCHELTAIFGKGTVEEEARKRRLPFLGDIPLRAQLSQRADRSQPWVEAAPPDDPVARAFAKLAQSVAQQLSIAQLGRPHAQVD